MSSRIDTIEAKIFDVLEKIDGTTQSTGYTYYTSTGSVQIYDEKLSLSRNINALEVNHYIDQVEGEGIYSSEFQVGQWAITNTTNYEIRSKVHNDGTESNAKNAIRIKLNEVFDDLLFAFSNRYTLDGHVSWIRFVSAIPKYETITNNRIQSATLITKWEVSFTQSIANTSIKSCA